MQVSLPCGDGDCPFGGQNACCWDAYQLNGRPQGECVQGSPVTDGCTTDFTGIGAETRIECALPDQCDGKLCCAHRAYFQGTSYYDETRCSNECIWPDVVICDADDANFVCPIALTRQGPVQTV